MSRRLVGKQPQTVPDPAPTEIAALSRRVSAVVGEVEQLGFKKANASTVGGITTRVNGLEGALAAKADVTAVAAVQQAVAGKADVSAITTVADSVARKADKADVPQPADAAPPPVQIDSVMGAASRFARADHTHESRLQARSMALTFVNGQADYSFPKAYPAGTVPILSVTAHNEAGQAYRYVVGVLKGSVSASRATITCVRVNQSVTLGTVLTGLLGAVLPIFTTTFSGTVTVDILSRAPS